MYIPNHKKKKNRASKSFPTNMNKNRKLLFSQNDEFGVTPLVFPWCEMGM